MEKEIQRLKNELYRRKEAVNEIQKLANRRIDRDFCSNIWELSEKELDAHVGELITFLNQNMNTKPDEGSIKSHRKIIGNAIVLMKRLLVKIGRVHANLILDKQIEFNKKIVELSQAILIQVKNNRERIEEIDEKIRDCEEVSAIAMIKFEELQQDLKHLKNATKDLDNN
jgi:hypothetical protein